MEHLRKAAVEGTFYPESCSKLNIYFQKFNDMIGRKTRSNPVFHVKPKAIIVPHAGYIYSGFTANVAYRVLSNSHPKRVIVIGPSHRYYFRGISGAYYESFETPCGEMDIDTDYLMKIAKKFNIGFEAKAHENEHSTEVQIPFIKHYLPKSKVIELVYGDISYKQIEPLIEYLLSDKDNAVVISSDLSHYYSKEKAYSFDKHCMKAISTLDTNELDRGCKACGIIGIKAMTEAAKSLGLHSKVLDYRTSADSSGDKSRVVGYTSAVYY